MVSLLYGFYLYSLYTGKGHRQTRKDDDAKWLSARKQELGVGEEVADAI